MTVRTDITVDFEVSPRIITVASPSVEVSIQDLHDTLTRIEDSILPEGPLNPGLIESAGKEALGSGTLVGITATLQDAQLAFQDRITELESGTVTTPDTNGVTLTDSAATFQANNVARGDIIYNRTDSSQATVISVSSEMELVCNGLIGGSDNQFDSADVYEIFDVVQCNISGGNLVAVDSADLEIDPVFPTFGTQIVRTSSSSATLQELDDIQYASFDNGISIDVVDGDPGTAYPLGNAANPVDNLTDAAAIDAVRGFKTLFLEKSLTISNESDWTDYVFIGHSIIDTVVTVDPAANVTKAEFSNCSLEGELGDTTILKDCFLGETNILTEVKGVIEDCSIGPATLTLGGTNTEIVRFVDCRGAGSGTSPPTINCNGDGPELDIQGYIGQLNIENKTGEANLEISINGKLTLDASVSNGIVVVNGQGTLVDNSGPGCLVIDNMVHGDKLTEVHIHRGLDASNSMTYEPTEDRSADGSIVVAKNRFHSHMNYGDAVFETLTRRAPAGVSFQLPLTTDLVATTGALTPTFARASTATYLDPSTGLIASSAIDVARFESRGWLVEESRTNKFTKSAEIDHGDWSKNLATITTDGAVSPDGGTNADAIAEDGTAAQNHGVGQNEATWSNDTAYTNSAWFKSANRSFVQLRVRPGDAVVGGISINLTTGGTQDLAGLAPDNSSIKSYANSWWRAAAMRVNGTGTANSQQQVFIEESLGDNVFDGLTQDSVYYWGTQLEEGRFSTSYIPTTTIEVTRSADFLSYDDDALLLDSAGSIYCELTPLFDAADAMDAVIVNIADQLIGPLYILADGSVNIGDGTNVATLNPNFVRGSLFKVAVRWSSSLNEMQVIVNGIAGSAVTYDGAFTRTAGTIYVGSDSTGNHFNGNIRNVIGYNADRGEDQLKVDTG